MSRRLLVALAVTGALLMGVATALVLFAHDFLPHRGRGDGLGKIVLDGIWIATGLLARQRRPGNRVGLLMVAAGFADLTGKLYWNASVPYVLFTALAVLQIPIFIHLFLAYPSGRLTSRLDRVLAYVSTAPGSSFFRSHSFRDSRTGPDNCPRCPTNPLRVVGLDTVAPFFEAATSCLVVGVFVVTGVLLVRKVRAARGATRRALAPVLLTRAVAILLFVPYLIVDAAGGPVEDPPLAWVGGAFTAIPIAFLVGRLRTRLQRSGVADLVVELRSLSRPEDVRDASPRARRSALAFGCPRRRYVDPRGSRSMTTRDARVTVLEQDGSGRRARSRPGARGRARAPRPSAPPQASRSRTRACRRAQRPARQVELRVPHRQAGDAERRRLERDLHDGAQQRLLGIRLALHAPRRRSTREGSSTSSRRRTPRSAHSRLQRSRAHPPAILTEEGLAPAIAALARRGRSADRLTRAFARAVEVAAYFVASEALANVAKHARASRATIASPARTAGRDRGHGRRCRRSRCRGNRPPWSP
jgi:signal transduction histidine kinase